MTIDELITRLEQAKEELGGETAVRIAIQPSYPLAASLKGLATTYDLEDDSAQEMGDETPTGCWLVANEATSYDASRYMWEVAN